MPVRKFAQIGNLVSPPSAEALGYFPRSLRDAAACSGNRNLYLISDSTSCLVTPDS